MGNDNNFSTHDFWNDAIRDEFFNMCGKWNMGKEPTKFIKTLWTMYENSDVFECLCVAKNAVNFVYLASERLQEFREFVEKLSNDDPDAYNYTLAFLGHRINLIEVLNLTGVIYSENELLECINKISDKDEIKPYVLELEADIKGLFCEDYAAEPGFYAAAAFSRNGYAAEKMGLYYSEVLDIQEKAKQCFEYALILEPDLVYAKYRLGKIYAGEGDTETAKSCFRGVLDTLSEKIENNCLQPNEFSFAVSACDALEKLGENYNEMTKEIKNRLGENLFLKMFSKEYSAQLKEAFEEMC